MRKRPDIFEGLMSDLPRLARQLYLLLLVCVAALILAAANWAIAGFGITPPYLENERLTRGSVYEQRIMLVRSDPVDDLDVEITTNVPGVDDWISIDRGRSFKFPKDTTQMPIIITVKVPSNAEYKEYTGSIRIRTAPSGQQPTGGVSIALGAQVDVDLKVVDKIYDFEVRRIRTVDLEQGRTRFGLFFPGKIRFFMTIKNTGNTEFGPTRVRMDIYDSNVETLLEQTENTNAIERIPPFGLKEVLAELPTRLGSGSYVAKYTIYKNDAVAQQGDFTLSVAAVGAVAGYEGYGFDGLSLGDKIKVFVALGLPLLLVLLLIAILISKRRRRLRTRAAR